VAVQAWVRAGRWWHNELAIVRGVSRFSCEGQLGFLSLNRKADVKS
jgi:hypothetical protein